MQSTHICLLIPGLLGPSDVKKTPGALDGLNIEPLIRALSRSQVQASVSGLTGCLFDCFAMQRNDGEDWPVAALGARELLDAKPPGRIFCADPVHLKADRDRIVMFGNRHLNVTQDEAQQLAREFNQLFGEDGIELVVAAPQRWYLKTDADTRISTTELSAAVGQDIHPLLPQDDDALHWHRLLNEVQMLFHNSPVNQEREARRLPTINSIWLWGGGVLPPAQAVDWQGVWSNESLAPMLADYHGVVHGSAPACGEDCLEQLGSGQHLIVLDGGAEAVQFDDIGLWREFVEGISEEWIAPMLQALKSGRIQQLSLETTQGQHFILTPKLLKRWWRRVQPLSHFLP